MKYLLTGGGKDPVVGEGPLVVVVVVVVAVAVAVEAVVRGADREGRLGSYENCTPCLPSITTSLT